MDAITTYEAKITADEQVDKWLSKFGTAASAANIDALLALFHADASWRDLLAFTWNIGTAEGRDAIREMLGACLARTAPLAWRRKGPARLDDEIVEGVATFETRVARCTAVIRLKHGKAWTLLTCMSELKELEAGFDARLRAEYPNGREHGRTKRPHHEKESEMLATTLQPYCVVVGAGHCGTALGAQLRQLGVPTLLIDSRERPSDTWRARHDSLSLHSPSYFDQMPGFSYPANWPPHPSKDQFANWLDAYRSVMDLDVWTSANCVAAGFDDACGRWRLQVNRYGRTIELKCEQLVLATGLFGAPKVPEIPGKERFKGLQRHASQYRRSPDYRGRRCAVVGAGTTAHDVAADLWASGADVTMVQRSPTIVMKLEALIEGFSQLYGEAAKARGITTELADLLFAATPMRHLVRMHQELVTQLKQRHARFYQGLERAGFQLTFGEDESGVFPQILRDPGGYYIDVGASDLVIDGRIKLKSGVGISALAEDSVVLSDGSELPADAIFYATGYERMSVAPIGETIAAKADRLWGLGSGTRNDPGPWEGELRNMWKPTQQTGLWFHAGGIGMSRFYSRILALQIKARQIGLSTPVYKVADALHAAPLQAAVPTGTASACAAR